uniref:Uncharacterized protein n=1 Tax=Cacopsylla melanoneura TaxID=428564 RepID=A0A8D8PWS5_9HEMI
MKFIISVTVVLISATYIENAEDLENPNEYNFLQSNKPIHEFINMFQKFHEKSNNLKRIKRAFDKSGNSMDTDEQAQIINALPDKTCETLEDDKLKLELGQKYNAEFKQLMKMDGIDLEESVVNQLNQSLVDMFTETMKETMNRYTMKNAYPGYVLQTEFADAIQDFQIEYKKKVTEWFGRINEELPNILFQEQHEEIKTPKGREIYQSLVNHKCKVLRRALRSFINHNYKRMEFEYMNRVMEPVMLSIPRSKKSCEALNFSAEAEYDDFFPAKTTKK